ncbi:MAG: TOMM precursor leader peptide-binding protein [Undibacterium sp.]|nr:TOMM precursor leader peptide-binding protein [Undibacterium sp.]
MKFELNHANTGSGSEEPHYRFWPIQVVRHDSGVILRRGTEKLYVAGAEAIVVIESLIEITQVESGATLIDMLSLFQEEQRDHVQSLLERLVAKRFLALASAVSEEVRQPTNEDVFYWAQGSTSAQAHANINLRGFVIVGVNAISARLGQSLAECGAERVTVIDHPSLRNLSYFDGPDHINTQRWPSTVATISYDDWIDGDMEFDGLIATSDFGGLGLMREWNEFCVREKKLFLPVVLQDMMGYVGPLVIPGETPCFECAWTRQSSNMNQPGLDRATEPVAFFGQAVDAWIPPMASMLGDLASLELVRFCSKVIAGFRTGVMTEVDMQRPELSTRRLLKVPRCRVCGPLTCKASATGERNIFMPGNDEAAS